MDDFDLNADAHEHDFDPYDDEDRDDVLGRCRECETWGEFQCRSHSDVYIAMMREQQEHHATIDALQTLIACPDALDTPTGRQLRALARGALAELGVEPREPETEDRDG